MKSTYRLGRVAGIEIGLNWSVLGLLALLMWTLATGIFPETNPGLGDNAHFAMAVVASLGFFASILLHELGHALQARREGMQIDGITLWLFGGVARFAGMFPSAGAEFRIAAAGPAVTALLAGGFVGAALIPGVPSSVDGVCSWLGFINLALLVFNLIPALPLDGGRMLRAALWARSGDLTKATVRAAGTGRFLAIGLIGLGFVMIALGDGVGGIWLAFIGWFVLQAAGAEARYVQASAQGMLRVRDMMTADPLTTSPGATLEEAAALGRDGDPYDAYPVTEDGHVLGLLPLRVLREVPPAEWPHRRVGEFALGLADAPVVTGDDTLASALAALQAAPVQCALVIDGGSLAGLLRITDIEDALRAGAGRTPSPASG
jgi:Zn-dependent protease